MTTKLMALAVLVLAMLAGSGRAAEPAVTDVGALERYLTAALKHNGEGNLDATLESVRAASHCDSVEDAVEKRPFGVKTPSLIEFHLRMALHELKDGKWWRAAILSRHMAGCYSATLAEESRTAVLSSQAGRTAKLDNKVTPVEWVTDWSAVADCWIDYNETIEQIIREEALGSDSGHMYEYAEQEYEDCLADATWWREETNRAFADPVGKSESQGCEVRDGRLGAYGARVIPAEWHYDYNCADDCWETFWEEYWAEINSSATYNGHVIEMLEQEYEDCLDNNCWYWVDPPDPISRAD